MPRPAKMALALDVARHHFLSHRRPPFLASYKLTYRCNLRCRQCPFPDSGAPTPSFTEACLTLDELHRRGNRVVIFEGGEPLLWSSREDGREYTFADVARYAHQRFACVGATTNGTLALDAPTDVLWVSLDGLAETHDRLRGAPVFDRVIDNILRSPHPRLYAHVTANAENWVEIPALVRSLKGLVRGVTVQFYYPYGPDDSLYLPPPERRQLLQRLIELKAAGYPMLNSSAALQALMDNRWRCWPWLIDCADPDGSIRQGCYLQGRAEIDCSKCGFSPYTEISLAFRLQPQAVLAGMRIFF